MLDVFYGRRHAEPQLEQANRIAMARDDFYSTGLGGAQTKATATPMLATLAPAAHGHCPALPSNDAHQR